MIVYLLYCMTSRMGYVGQTTRTLEERWKEHMLWGKDLIGEAIREHGAETFELSVLATTDNLEELARLEVREIEKHGTRAPRGYNIRAGGNRPPSPKGRKHSAETLAKMRKPKSALHAAHIGATKIGNKYKLGTKHTPETLAKMSESAKKRTPEYRAMLSSRMMGNRHGKRKTT